VGVIADRGRSQSSFGARWRFRRFADRPSQHVGDTVTAVTAHDRLDAAATVGGGNGIRQHLHHRSPAQKQSSRRSDPRGPVNSAAPAHDRIIL